MKKSGFIGPIGDDLPSLIPLVFALMMFFYVFTFTWNAFDQKGRIFQDNIDALKVGDSLKGNNYLSGFDSFNANCEEAQIYKRIKFMAGLVPLSTGPGQTFPGLNLDNIEQDFFESNGQKFMCTNAEPQEKPTNESLNLIIRSFPVALEFQNTQTGLFYVRPMLLVVVTWR
jgi:hypothetical protein